MKIGALAAATGTPVETVRFYEREGLLPAPARTHGNYRVYDAPHAERLAFIRHCRGLGMTLAEIRVLLQFRDSPADPCDGVNELLDAHLAQVATRLRELKALERQLKALRQACSEAREACHCGILNGLTAAASQGSRRPREGLA